MALNELVSRVQGHNDLSSQSVNEFVACDNNLETGDNTTTYLENLILDKYLEQQNKIPAESDDEEKLPEENETGSSMKKYSKISFDITARATLKCIQDKKSFLLESGAAHLLTPLCEIEKGLCEMSTNALKQKLISNFLIVVIECM